MNDVTAGCFGIVQGGADFVLELSALHRAAVRGAGLDDADGLELGKDFDDLLGRPGTDEAELHHTDLGSLFPEVVNREPGGTAVRALEEDT